MSDTVNEQLLTAGLRRVIQCARGAERDPFGGPLRTTWLDTEWDSIEDAQFHHPEYIYRNVIIGGEDEQFEEEKTEESTSGGVSQGLIDDARRLNEKFRDDLEEAGIPTTRIFRSMEDCGCGLGPECTIKR